jgi:D-3-phosphoglycerate dehydrogenase
MTSALLMGLLQPAIESVNMVNASSVAKERGIAVKESKNTAEGDFHTLIRLRITSPNALFTLAGSLFSGKPRIVNIDGVEIDGKIFPRMLFVRNHDKPGAVAGLTAALAAANINIADLQLGRVAAGEDAVALIGVDSEVSAPMRKQIEALPHMVSVHGLKFSNGG